MEKKIIKVLVVEDSTVVQNLMKYIINSDPDMRVVAIISDGEEALAATQKYKPDVITMDLTMPKMDGIEATRQIMETCATPIVVVTGSNRANDVSHSAEMIRAGALAVHLRPHGIGHPDHEMESEKLINTLKLMSEVRVITRVRRKSSMQKEVQGHEIYRAKALDSKRIDVVAIGVSTGGPPLLQKLISGLPKELSVPVLIVQHMAPKFITGFAEWLEKSSQFPVHVARNNEILYPGHVYLAPDLIHMTVNSRRRINLVDNGYESGHKPSVAHLFQSVAEVYKSRAIGILLTGMGKDGADELKLMKDAGAITIAQNRESSSVFGMPGEAIRLNAVTYVFSPEEIIEFLSILSTNET